MLSPRFMFPRCAAALSLPSGVALRLLIVFCFFSEPRDSAGVLMVAGEADPLSIFVGDDLPPPPPPIPPIPPPVAAGEDVDEDVDVVLGSFIPPFMFMPLLCELSLGFGTDRDAQ
jgi:hypothetical protein